MRAQFFGLKHDDGGYGRRIGFQRAGGWWESVPAAIYPPRSAGEPLLLSGEICRVSPLQQTKRVPLRDVCMFFRPVGNQGGNAVKPPLQEG